MSGSASLPLVVRLLLRVLPLGDRRAEVTADIADLFLTRRATRGAAHAYFRLLEDLASLVLSSGSAASEAAVDGLGGVESCVLDLRYGLRLLRKHPGVIAATVGGLALAIAVGTSVFTILNATVLRPYGMDDPRSVVRVQMRLKGGVATDWPYHGFLDLADKARQSRVLASSSESVRIALSPGDEPTRVDTLLLVSGQYMTVLGGRPAIGRTLLPSDDAPSAAPAVVVNHRFWSTRLNADRNIVGKTIWLSGHPVTMVGVVESGFTGPAEEPPAVWATFGSYGAILGQRPIDRSSDTFVSVIARVERGVSRDVAAQELSAIAAALPDVGIRSATGALVAALGVRLDGAGSPLDGRDGVAGLLAMGAVVLVVGLVLALACANVANLLLAGAATRSREIGVRLALGAPRRRILRQLLTESILIGLIAGGAGLGLSMLIVPTTAKLLGLPDTLDVAPDMGVLLFASAMALVSGVAAGISPARFGARGDLTSALRLQGADGAAIPTAAQTRRLFIGFQAAGSTLLLVAAALFLRAAVHLVHLDVGFDADRLAGVTAEFPRVGFDTPAIDAYWRAAIDRVRSLPSVERVALTSSLPLGNDLTVREVGSMQRNGVEYLLFEHRTSADYFAAGGFPLLRGRTFDEDDVRANAPVAVVSESVARDFFGGRDPIGASLADVSPGLRSFRIIGVVAEAVTERMRGRGNGGIYRPLTAADIASAHLLVRSPHPELIARDLETALTSVDPRVRPEVSLMSENVDRFTRTPKILAGVSGAVAIAALVLAVLGIYGITTFAVHQRLREMQVRRAVGASGADIAALLARQSLSPVGAGLIAGLAIGLPAARVVAPILSGISPSDPVAILGAVVVLIVAAITAVAVPARRAARVDPAALLRA